MHFDDLRVAGIFFWGRSGSVFLHSLFDSHPEVLTMPASRLNAFHAREWPKIACEPEIEDMARRFVALNPSLFDGREDRWFEGLDAMGPGRDTPLTVDAEAFVRELSALLAPPTVVTRRRFFLAAHVAYALARGEDVSRKTTVIYHLHSPEAYANVQAALDDFPGLRAVGITREPIRSTLSYLRKNVLAARAWEQADRSEYAQLAPTGGYNFVYRHQLIGWRELLARYPIPFLPVRIEDINRDTEAEMRSIAEFFGLSWHPCLLESTFNGLAYGGDLLAIGQSNGTARRAPSSEESDAALDPLDRYVLSGLLANFRREFGYGDTPALQRWLTPLLLLVPTRLERRALLESLSRPGATLRQMFARHRYSYRHLLCEAVPELRSLLPLPAPLSPGLRLPARRDAAEGVAASKATAPERLAQVHADAQV
ncbi:MAG TPA: sulfotransferase [Polyangiaceae bacterium]|nr:sulfotransferase [Polyangiaceae bacterium]